jgi:hypothetical protein
MTIKEVKFPCALVSIYPQGVQLLMADSALSRLWSSNGFFQLRLTLASPLPHLLRVIPHALATSAR